MLSHQSINPSLLFLSSHVIVFALGFKIEKKKKQHNNSWPLLHHVADMQSTIKAMILEYLARGVVMEQHH